MTNVKTEVIFLNVRVRITYDKDIKKSRTEAIEDAKDCVLSTSKLGYPVSSKPYLATLLK